jgi:hypothetical protein
MPSVLAALMAAVSAAVLGGLACSRISPAPRQDGRIQPWCLAGQAATAAAQGHARPGTARGPRPALERTWPATAPICDQNGAALAGDLETALPVALGLAALSSTFSYDHDLASFARLAFPQPLTERSVLTPAQRAFLSALPRQPVPALR